MDPRLIFLCTDGRYSTLGRDLNADASGLIATVRAQGLRGWIVEASGSLVATRFPRLTIRQVVDADAGEWDAAVAAAKATR